MSTHDWHRDVQLRDELLAQELTREHDIHALQQEIIVLSSEIDHYRDRAKKLEQVPPDALIETIRQAHAKAMEALGADVHPYSASAIRAWEAEMDAALDAVAGALAGLPGNEGNK